MTQMQAVFLPGNKHVEIRSIPVPDVGPDDVLLEMHASCICRSDLSLYYGNAVVGGGDATGGFVCGHEPAGTVVATGEAVTEFAVGDRVAVDDVVRGRKERRHSVGGRSAERIRLVAHLVPFLSGEDA